MQYSLTQAGNLTVLIGFLLKLFKVNIGDEEVTQFVQAAVIIVGLVGSWWGRYRQGDITLSGFKK